GGVSEGREQESREQKSKTADHQGPGGCNPTSSHQPTSIGVFNGPTHQTNVEIVTDSWYVTVAIISPELKPFTTVIEDTFSRAIRISIGRMLDSNIVTRGQFRSFSDVAAEMHLRE